LFKKGDLVKWFETYGDIHITKDCGLGVIVDISRMDYFTTPHYTFKVFRIEKEDFMFFEEHNLEHHPGAENV
tara:strand:+ start:2652 stop:2867 length:216 start_codon:yes stop_codon:yes gene_type:complete